MVAQNKEEKANQASHGYCKVFTKFMENYRLSSDISMGKYLQGIHRQNSTAEFYCKRGDGYIQRFFESSGSSTGFDSQKMQQQGVYMSAVSDDIGKILVFASRLEELFVSVEKTPLSGDFDSPSRVQVSLPYNAKQITGIFSKKINNDIWIAVVVETIATKGSENTFVVLGKWDGQKTVLHNTGYNISSNICAWTEGAADPIFAIASENFVGINAKTNELVYYPPLDMPRGAKCTALDCVFDEKTKKDIFIVATSDGGLRTLKSQNAPKWDLRQAKSPFSDIKSYRDFNNRIHFFGLGADSGVYHSYVSVGASATSFTEFINIIGSAASFSIGAENGHYPHLFVADKVGKAVSYMLFEESSYNWNIQKITLPSDHNVISYSSYASEVTAYDSNGVVCPNTEITVWSEEKTRIEVNGQIFFIAPDDKAALKTDHLGKLSIVQETASLAVPELYVGFKGVHALKSMGLPPAEEAVLVISQYAPVEKKLKNIDGKAILDAKKANGSALLPKEYNTKATADSLAQALRESVKLIDKPNGLLEYKDSGDSCAVWLHPSNLRRFRSLSLKSNGAYAGWSVAAEGGQIVFKHLLPEDIDALMAQVDSQGSFGGFFSRIGDFFRAVAQKAVEVVKVVVTVVEGVVKTIIEYIKDKVKYFFNAVTHTVQEIWNNIEIIFSEVKVFFEDIYKWLGFIFNWDDVLRTKKMLDYSVLESLKFMDGMLDYLSSKVAIGIEYLKTNVKNSIDGFVAKVGADMSIGASLNGSGFDFKTDDKFAYSLSNNFVYNGFMARDFYSQNTGDGLFLTTFKPLESSIEDFMKILEKYTSKVSDNTAFKEAYKYFKGMFSDRHNLFNLMICGLAKVIEGVVTVMFDGVNLIVQALLSLCKGLIEALRKILTAQINLPFVSSLFSKIAGGEKLTLLGVSGLLLAAPMTVLYKVVTNKAPFKDDKDLQEFKTYFNATVAIRALKGESSVGISPEGVIPKKYQSILAATNAISSFWYYSLTAVVDGVSVAGTAPVAVVGVAFAFEALLTLGSIPVWTTSPSVAEIVNCALLGVGMMLDIIFIAKEKMFPDNSKTEWPKVTVCIYGICFLATGIVASLLPSQKAGATTWLSNIIPPIICITKIGLLKKLIAATEGISPVVTVGAGALGGLTVGLCSAISIAANEQNDG